VLFSGKLKGMFVRRWLLAGLCLAGVLVSTGQARAAGEWPRPRPIPTQEGELPVPVVELYTMGRGGFLVEKFGHAALCLRYRGWRDRDVCYNYGVTDFTRPISLGWGFLRGRANFWVSTIDPGAMLAYYRRQVLPLSQEQALLVEAKLAHDELPENRHYTYHHFYDNCTTRVRDIVDRATGGALSKGSDKIVGPSFREYGRRGFAEQTWLLVVSDFILGRAGDVQPTLWEAMFLPRILRAEVEKRLGLHPQPIYSRRGRPFSDGGSSGRGWIVLFAVLLALPATITIGLRRQQRVGIGFSMVPLGLLGLAIWGLAIISSLAELRYNEALLVFIPLDLALPFVSVQRRLRYARARVGGLVAVAGLLEVGVFKQPLWLPMLMVLPPLLVIAFLDRVPAAARARGSLGEIQDSADAA
jgi:hypothetical protein